MTHHNTTDTLSAISPWFLRVDYFVKCRIVCVHLFKKTLFCCIHHDGVVSTFRLLTLSGLLWKRALFVLLWKRALLQLVSFVACSAPSPHIVVPQYEWVLVRELALLSHSVFDANESRQTCERVKAYINVPPFSYIHVTCRPGHAHSPPPPLTRTHSIMCVTWHIHICDVLDVIWYMTHFSPPSSATSHAPPPPPTCTSNLCSGVRTCVCTCAA